MKNRVLFIIISLLAATAIHAQKWSDLTDEQKVMKLKSFRADNQAYLKNTLGMTPKQLDDIDNVNACFLGTLDRINRYGKSDENKEKYAEAVASARSAQLDAIMGVDKHKQYSEYLQRKIEMAKKK